MVDTFSDAPMFRARSSGTAGVLACFVTTEAL